MIISTAELDRRFDDHVSAARLAKGGRIMKSAAYYGEGLEDSETRERIETKCKKLGIGGQFVEMYTTTLTGLRLWMKGKEHGTD